MKKLLIILIIYPTILYSGATTITVVDGSSYEYSEVADAYYAYSLWEAIYPKGMIGRSGWIGQIQFEAYRATTFTRNNVKIYMGSTTTDTFANYSSGFWLTPNGAGLTLVWSGNITISATGWYTINLTDSINYDNTKNLVIMVDGGQSGASMGTGSTSNGWYYNTYTVTPGYRHLHYRSSTTDADPNSPPTATVYGDELVSLKLRFYDPDGSSCITTIRPAVVMTRRQGVK